MNMVRSQNSVKVGAFRKNGNVISGWIRTFLLNVDYAELVPVPPRGENTPSFEVWGANKAGNLAHLGTLWPRKTKKDQTPFHGGFVDDRGPQGEMQVAVFGDLEMGADMVWRTDDGNGFARPQSAGGGDRQGYGGFPGGSTAGPGGEYIGANGAQSNGFGGFAGGSTAGPNGDYTRSANGLDDDVPF